MKIKFEAEFGDEHEGNEENIIAAIMDLLPDEVQAVNNDWDEDDKDSDEEVTVYLSWEEG